MKTAKPVGGTRSRAGVPRGDAGSVKGETGGTPVFADLVFDVSPVPMWVYDPVTLEFLRVNDAAIRAYGFSREQFLAMTLLDIRPAEDREAYAAWARERDLSTTFRTPQRWRHLRADGSIVYVDSHYSERFVDEGRDAVLAIVLDLTDQKAEADRLHALAFTDQATGLPNRAGLLDRVERERFPVGGLVLVRVAWVAESASRSQAARERAVRAIAAKLCALAPRDALVTRYGDQSFAMVTRRTERLRAPLPIARKIATAFERPVQTGAEEFVVVPTIGVASAEDGATSVADIALNAEAALGQAERNPNRIAVFTEDIQRAHDRRATVERNLRNAIVQERVGVVYQPIVALATGTVVGAEALMRWDCPGLGPVPPSEFIAIAEESGVILRLGEWILRAAVLEARRWQLAGLGRLRIAVNVSPLQVEQREFVRLVLSSCEAVGLDPADVELEITERVMMHRDGPAMRNLEALRRLGVRVSIDDFGTGYSALSYLSSVPLDTVKLDRGFVDAVNADAYQTDIAADVIRLARGRGLTVVAEGIETPAQRDWLRTVGCDEAQGYLFARPADAENFPAVVAALQRNAAG